jgi:iron complex transport system permease protein
MTNNLHPAPGSSSAAAVMLVIADRRVLFWISAAIALLLLVAVSLSVGRYNIEFGHVIGILLSHLWPVEPTWTETEQRVVDLIRIPRVLAAGLAGAGLSIAGAALQGTFRNPLVGPEIIGVSAGAGFGGSLAILALDSPYATVACAFVGGMVAITVVYFMSQIGRRMPILMLVLSGVITSAFFSALISLVKFIADPQNKLPAIVYWLMGSFASADGQKVLLLLIPVAAGGLLLYRLRFRINVLSAGDEEAEALGVPVARTRWIILAAVALISAAVVAVAGIVGWVGLVVPHFARIIVGPDHKSLLPASAVLGALYLIAIDGVARTATAAEIPLGIITAIIGAPVFALLLVRSQAAGWRQ